MATIITFSDRININFPETLLGSTLDMNGSGINGRYIPNTSPKQLNGSGGGVLSCLSTVILINLTGTLHVSSTLQVHFTGLLTINISGNDVTLNITNHFAKDSQHKTYTLTITDNCSNAVLANHTRYLNIGSFTLNFSG
jgi:hypothetical protein